MPPRLRRLLFGHRLRSRTALARARLGPSLARLAVSGRAKRLISLWRARPCWRPAGGSVLANPAGVSPWVMAAGLVAASPRASRASPFRRFAAPCCSTCSTIGACREIMMICSVAGQALMVWSLRRDIVGAASLSWPALPSACRSASIACCTATRPLRPRHRRAVRPLCRLHDLPPADRRAPAACRRAGGLPGRRHRRRGGFPGAFVTIWCGFKGFSKERQRGHLPAVHPDVQLAALPSRRCRAWAPRGASTSRNRLCAGHAVGSSCGMVCFKWLNDRQFAHVNLLSRLSFLL